MNSIESVRKSVEIFRKHKVSYALLHCTNIYPTPYELVRLGAMNQLENEFPDAVIGLSDHTINNYACLGAVALGASILERHFTDTKSRVGPDIICSMDKRELKELIYGSKILKKARGGEKSALKEEQATIDFAFSTVVSIKEIKKGEYLSKENIWVKRPGVGEILAEKYEDLIGKVAVRDISNDKHLEWDDFQ